MTYTPILNAEVDAESPVTDLLMTRLRDNPIAIVDGDADAPRIQFAALDAWFSTEGAIGTYVFAHGAGDVAFGSTVAGSTLRPTSAARSFRGGAATTATFNEGPTLAGTWRCMGTFDQTVTGPDEGSGSGPTMLGATLWLRIS
jgi:hypothetical protein